MGFFSKWFGSNNGVDSEQEEEKQPSLNIGQFQQPNDLPEALRYIVEKWGVDYLNNRNALNVLNDFQVLKDLPAAKHIFMLMQANDYMHKISQISNWELESKSISSLFSNEFGTKEDIVIYIVKCIGYGLHFCPDKPNYDKEELIVFDPPKTEEEIPIKTEKQNNVESISPCNIPQDGDIEPYDPKREFDGYNYPTLDMLNKTDNKCRPYIDMAEQVANKNRIVDVLRSFGIEITSIKATVGPSVTLYEITLAPGVRFTKVRSLEDDIALCLSPYGVRLIVPIPGKSAIGIEAPNSSRNIVSIESVLNSSKFNDSKMDLPCAIGKTMTNEVFMFDLAKAPHLLVAGAIGQGKTVGLYAILTSLLFKLHPSELKLVFIDNKRLDFSIFSSLINHFLAKLPTGDSIVTNASDAVHTLDSLCKLLDIRCNLMKQVGARNIKEYNNKFVARQIIPRDGHGYMPYIVVVIDDYGDIVMETGKSFESPMLQLVRLGRIAGIHIIISTRRPISKIITDEIKSHFSTRIAFKVSARSDSNNIIDCPDAAFLTGRGDMLFQNGLDIERVQCAYVDSSEIERICDYISFEKNNGFAYELPDPYYEEYVAPEVDMEHLDPLFEDAARLVVVTQSGSTSLIQRKFAIGYNRAERMMDQLEKAGIVGAANGSKPREVLIQDENSLNSILSALR